MGTRADFYIGRGADAEWLGSVAWDGYPDGFEDSILRATDADHFRQLVAAELKSRDDGTTPEMGWPWPWDTSRTTDYAYAFDGDQVFGSSFGGDWFNPLGEQDEEGEYPTTGVPAVFPNMKERQNMTMGPRSGVIVLVG